METKLTGNIRYRAKKKLFSPTLIVLQVEFKKDIYTGWRDAVMEDLNPSIKSGVKT